MDWEVRGTGKDPTFWGHPLKPNPSPARGGREQEHCVGPHALVAICAPRGRAKRSPMHLRCIYLFRMVLRSVFYPQLSDDVSGLGPPIFRPNHCPTSNVILSHLCVSASLLEPRLLHYPGLLAPCLPCRSVQSEKQAKSKAIAGR